jgi:glutamate-1-semialdehyde 2,1-aminomutase
LRLPAAFWRPLSWADRRLPSKTALHRRIDALLDRRQQACRRHGTLLILDETHTVSSGLGGHGRQLGLAPDLIVVGKAVAGGMPCAVYGFTAAVAERLRAAKASAPEGHSGIGTTLSAGLLGLAALRATLAEVMTPATYVAMEAGAARLQAGLERVIAAHRQPWCVTRLGARMELQFCPQAPRDAREARAAMHEPLERLLHLWMLNRGVLLTPFHNMLLVSPETSPGAVEGVCAQLDALLVALDVEFS